jgi:hypothetical protein
MIPHVIEARHVGDHKVWLKFDDGLAGEIDLYDELDGPVFEPLRDPSYFARFSIRYHTISWENGADFAPEFLWQKIAQQQTRATDGPKSATQLR